MEVFNRRQTYSMVEEEVWGETEDPDPYSVMAGAGHERHPPILQGKVHADIDIPFEALHVVDEGRVGSARGAGCTSTSSCKETTPPSRSQSGAWLTTTSVKSTGDWR